MSIHEGMDFGNPGEYWIAVDLDGTLVEYDGWKGPEHFGKVIPAMLDRIHNWIDEGKKVAIFTARAGDEFQRHKIAELLIHNGLGTLEITNIKSPKFKEFWDDRAVGVIKNTGEVATGHFESKIDEIETSDDMFADASEQAKDEPLNLIRNDTGSHYRYSYRGGKLDPARIQMIYGATHPMQGAILKKTLKAGGRGHNDVIQDIDDIICAAERWKEMIIEDGEK